MSAPKTSGITLTDITYLGRQGVKYGLILLVVLMVGRMTLNFAIAYWKALNPPKPPAPTMGFGQLPAVMFPEQTSDDKPVTYKLELATGKFPEFPDRMKVFFMPLSAPSLLDDQNARKLASTLGFSFEPTRIGTEYRFTKSQPLSSTLELDSVTHDFKLTSDYLSRPELIVNPDLPNQGEAVSQVRSFLSAADLIESDMATSSGEVVYLKSIGSELQPALSFSEAEFVQVDLNRTPVDNAYPFFTPGGLHGIAHAILSGGVSKRDQIVEMEFWYQPIQYSEVETYPLRSVQSAWEVLKSGEGYIAEAGESQTAVVRDVSLGYFDSFEEQPYMQPIFVFSGDAGFLGYVPALDPAVTVPNTEL